MSEFRKCVVCGCLLFPDVDGPGPTCLACRTMTEGVMGSDLEPQDYNVPWGEPVEDQ